MRKITSENLYIVLKAVEDEPDFPGISDEMWKTLENASREDMLNGFKLMPTWDSKRFA